MEKWLNACDFNLAAYRTLCALALKFEKNTLLDGNYGEDEQTIKYKIFSWQ